MVNNLIKAKTNSCSTLQLQAIKSPKVISNNYICKKATNPLGANHKSSQHKTR